MREGEDEGLFLVSKIIGDDEDELESDNLILLKSNVKNNMGIIGNYMRIK